jgi:hypothetical protein
MPQYLLNYYDGGDTVVRLTATEFLPNTVNFVSSIWNVRTSSALGIRLTGTSIEANRIAASRNLVNYLSELGFVFEFTNMTLLDTRSGTARTLVFVAPYQISASS